MAYLKFVKGNTPGLVIPLSGPKTVLGRHPNCQVVLDNAAVSRHHAQILENHGSFYLEDLRSRNGTRLNDEVVDGRVELTENDTISVCDVVLTFHEQLSLAMPVAAGGSQSGTGDHLQTIDEPLSGVPFAEGLTDSSSIITTFNTRSSTTFGLRVKAETKLKAVLEIGRTLANVLDLRQVLEKTLDELFRMYPQADEAFALLRNAETGKLSVGASKSRRPGAEGKMRISMTIVEQAMNSGNAILSSDVVRDSRFKLSESLSEMQIKSMMCIPLSNQRGDSLGVMQISTMNLKREFTAEDLELMCSIVAQISLAVENANLHEKLLQQREAQRDLEFATQIQLGFLPNERPHLPGYEFSDYYEAAMRVGGDYFDYVQLTDGRMAVALGDVAGKGVPASLLMARLYSSARFHLLTQKSLAQAMSGLNAEIASSGLGHRFITFVTAVVDHKKHEITICNAGHLPPLLRRADGTVESLALAESGMPLGVAASQEFRESVVPIAAGDMVTLYTDGVTEAMNGDNEIYGRARLEKFLSQGPSTVDGQIQGIIDDVEQWSAGRPQKDDMCLVSIKRL